MPPLLSSNAFVDLDCLVQDLVEVCRSPAALSEPDVGRATLALSAATTILARVAETRAEVSRTHKGVQEAFRQAHEALDRARAAADRARLTHERARTLVERSTAPRPAVGGVPPLVRAWTTARAVHATCAACAGRMTVRYQYRFMEGLAATELRCPRSGCQGALTFYLPVNHFRLTVSTAE